MEKIRYTLILIFLYFSIVGNVGAATLSVSPASGTFKVGDIINAKIMVSTSEPINAISGVVSFPSSLFVIESISKSGSVLNFWVTEPNFSQGAGTLSFEGLTLGGYPGGTGVVVTAVLRAISTGTGSVVFQSGQVLLNDGQGSDGTSGMGGAVFSVEAKPEIVPLPVQDVPSKPEIKEDRIEETEEIELKDVEVDVKQEPPTLRSPEIFLSKKYGEQVILGDSDYPNSQVLLTFISDTGVKVFITEFTDVNGEFSILVPSTLKYGQYKVSAIVIQEDLSHTHTSNEIDIVIGNILSDIDIKIAIALVLFICLFTYFIIRTYSLGRRNRGLRGLVKKEAKEARNILLKSFAVLNDDLKNGIDKKTNSISKGKIKELKEDLKDAEDIINKEIKDIEKL